MKNTDKTTSNAGAGAESAQERKNRYMNRRVKELLGSTYSWDSELYYIGNPISEYWQSDQEKRMIAIIERTWHEATSI
jgi:hypothetical protein